MYKDEDDRVIDRKEAYHDVKSSEDIFEGQTYGEVMTGEEMDELDQIDPVVNILKNSGILKKRKSWEPSLNSIKEETNTQLRLIQRYLDDPFDRKPTRRLCHRILKLDNKIQNAIKDNGLYRVRIDTTNKIQKDSGANRSVTSMKHHLIDFQPINKYPIGGVNENGPAIYCTGKGYLPWELDNGEIVLVKCFYCKDVDTTIISPTDIVVSNCKRFTGWDMLVDCNEGVGKFRLRSRDGINQVTFNSNMENNFWFHYMKPPPQTINDLLSLASRAIIKRMTVGASVLTNFGIID